MKKLFIISCFLLLGLALSGFGWTMNEIYDKVKDGKDIIVEWGDDRQRQVDGVYFQESEDFNNVMDEAHKLDDKGDWVCVNVAYDMKPEEAYETCVHECSHKAYSEIFAEECEDDPDKCLEFINEK